MKKKLGLIFGIILFISGFNEFLFTSENVVLYNFSLVGFYISITSMIFYVYSLYTSKKFVFIVSNSGIIIGFLVSMLSLYYVYSRTDISLGLGFYLYILSHLVYITSLFSSEGSEEKITEEIPIFPNVEPKKDILFVRGKYILGIKDDEPLSNCECLLTIDNNCLHIVIAKGDKTFNHDINIDLIEDVLVKKVVLMNQNNNKIEDHTVENIFLMNILFGTYGNLIYQTGILDDSGKDTKISYQYTYEAEFICQINNEQKKIIFQLYQDPSQLIKSIKK